ncbi:sensor histidine kinase [Alcanivorax hongdengensis A-11-3]|uniref:Sensor histidine kinase n=2 Tax=Alcanivorax hongdengensis TaxID=519051 RepID=L0WDA1_9GAMM|nr:sensor histidine kinase [Alcanivorax hongdengensis A-11-3]
MLAVAVLVILLTAATTYVRLTLPWLGMDFTPADRGAGMTVQRIAPDSPNRSLLKPGMVLRFISSSSGETLRLHADLLLGEPDILSYPRLDRFLEDQERLGRILRNNPVVTTDEGRQLPIRTSPTPWTSLLGSFALQISYALVAFFISVGIWVVRPGQAATRFFALSGLSVLINELPLSIYNSRELYISHSLFETLSAINHLGSLAICASLVSLFWVYPRRLVNRPMLVPALLATAGGICWLLTLMRTGEGARTTVYLPILISYGIGLVFAALQWRASRHHPTDRAALKWCLLAIFTGTVMLIGMVTIPPVFGAAPLVPIAIGYSGFLMVYLGLAAGLLRYRLFDIERWWFKTWLWFAAGLLVILIDFALIFFLKLADHYALALSLAVSGWVYFPLRQQLWQKISKQHGASREQTLQEIVDKLFSAAGEQEISTAWPSLLKHTFQPLQLKIHDQTVEGLTISADGVRMLVPPLGPQGVSLMLEFPSQGGRLFSPEDLRIADLLYNLTAKALQGLRAREAGAELERNRMMRDLHDDLGARLLDVVYAADSPRCRDMALQAIEDLHGLVDTTAGQAVSLRHLCTNCEGETRARLNETPLTLDWRVPESLPERMTSARASANITRTLREAVTNIIRHANASQVKIHWQMSRHFLTITVDDDGEGGSPTDWSTGHGTKTIRTRTRDLGGSVTWRNNRHGGCQLEICLPMPLNSS